MTTDSDHEWFADYANIILLTSHMAYHHDLASEIAYAVEKPWKYTDTFREAQAEAATS